MSKKKKICELTGRICAATSRVEDGNYVIISRYSLNCSLLCFLTLLEKESSPGKVRSRSGARGAKLRRRSLRDAVAYSQSVIRLFRAWSGPVGDPAADYTIRKLPTFFSLQGFADVDWLLQDPILSPSPHRIQCLSLRSCLCFQGDEIGAS